ncbi:nucleotidyltransferase family protein [Saccharicrinis aurantiacus]|uniref:nucleotidyltransferase family protein n=1 Tax=Saccharicrinis aurantiacus TaxID=1849719 RepID=UPI002492A5C6|nr:nucleotidyltransferase family protein [Saccharicrinis aurantiacus]
MIKPTQNIALVILAAGKGQRMGEAKQLMRYKNKALINHQVDKALELGAKDVYLVVGAHKERIENALTEPSVHMIYNENWEKGIGASIAKAVQVISELGTYDAVLISLADQPLIPLEHYRKLLMQFQSSAKSIIATKAEESIGVPAVFGKRYFSALMDLQDNKGAKSIINSNKDTVTLVCLGKGYLDIDTPEDYRNLLQNQ